MQPVSALAWSRNGSELAGVSVDGDLALYLLEDRQALHIQLGKRNDDLGPITQIALLQQRHDAHPAALLALSARGLVVDLYSLSNPKRPTSRVRIDQSDAANSPSPDQAFGRASLLPQYDTILLSTSIGNQLHAIKFDLPAELSPPSRLTDYVTWCKGPLSASQQEADSVNAGLKSSPYFIDTQSISTPHHVLQMVSAELSEKPGIFYLHADGFEQISLDPAFYDAFESKTSNESEANSGSSEVNKGLPTQTEAPKPSTANGNEFLEAFDNSVRDLPHFSNAPLQSADAATGRTSPAVNSVPIDTTSATDSTHETFQHLITQQNLVFSQMLAAQQQIHETRYQQLSKELALL